MLLLQIIIIGIKKKTYIQFSTTLKTRICFKTKLYNTKELIYERIL